MALGDDLGTNLVAALNAAPDLSTAPSLAVAAAQQSDPTQAAQGLAHAANINNVDQAVQNVKAKHGQDFLHQALGWLGGEFHNAKNAIGAAGSMLGKVANAPLQEVTHEYRYTRGVFARYGAVDGILETLGAVAGAAAGGLAGTLVGDPLHGAILGAEAEGELGRVIHPDVWEQTKPGYRDPTTGKPVSPGRDIAHLLGVGNGFWTSGLLDGIFDLSADPLAVGGKLGASARAASLTPQGVTAAARAADVERIAVTSGSFGRWASAVADMDAGTIAARFPWVGKVTPADGELETLAQRLGAASTKDEVVDVVRNAVGAREMLGPLPSIQLGRVPFTKLNEAILNYDGPGAGAIDAVRSKFTAIPVFQDMENHTLSNAYMDPASPQASNIVYHEMRFGFDDATARQVANAWEQAPTLADKLLIRRNGIVDMLVHMGLPEDGDLIRRMRGAIDDAQGVGMEAQYARDVEGRDLSKVLVDDGHGGQMTTPAAVLQSQTGVVPLLDYRLVRKQVQSLNNVKQVFGAIDDFAFNKFTGTIFKPLVLLSAGTAERMSLSEALPAALRYGLTNMVKSSISANIAKLGLRDSFYRDLATAAAAAGEGGGLEGVDLLKNAKNAELNLFQRAVLKASGFKASVLADPDRIDVISKQLLVNGGHIVDPMLSATESASAESVGKAAATTDSVFKAAARQTDTALGDRYTLFGHDSAEQVDRWQRHLSSISKDAPSVEAAKAYRDALASGASEVDASAAGARAATDWLRSQSDLSIYKRSVAASDAPLEEWGNTVMENVKGATHSPRIRDAQGVVTREAAPHAEILDSVANGQVTPRGLLDSVPVDDRPLAVPGRETLVIHNGTIENIANWGWSKILGPILNKMSREPIYNEEFYRQYSALKPLVESGDLTDAEAVQRANEAAVNGVIPFIHNPHDRSQFAIMARNFMPFYFAQTQAYRRFGHLLESDPGAFARFALIASSFSNAGSLTKDANGKSYLNFPGSGFLTQGAVGALGMAGIGGQMSATAPVSFSGQLKSASTIFPFTEDPNPLHKMGPVVSIASHALMSLFPEMTPAITSIEGDRATSGGIWDAIIPNQTLKNLVATFAPGAQGQRSAANATMSIIQALSYQQEKAMDAWVKAGHDPLDPGHPTIVPTPADGVPKQQEFIDRVKNQQRILFALKTVVGAVSPLAPVLDIGDMGLKTELRDMIAKEGLSKGLADFLVKNPDATPYTVFMTKSRTGAPIEATVPGQDWIGAHSDLMSKYPSATPWLLPQVKSDPFSQAVYNEQLATHLRDRKTPSEFLDSLYVAAGNAQFFGHDLPTHKANLAAAGDDPEAKRIENQAWNDYLTNTAAMQNPTWWADFKSDKTNGARLAVDQLERMKAANELPAGPQTDGVMNLLDGFHKYESLKMAGRTDPGATQSRTELKTSWENYLDSEAAASPELAPVIHSVFRRLA